MLGPGARPIPVLVVGAGPVGLTAAALLVQAGVPVRVVERERDLPEDMRASTFHPATLEIIDRLGLARPLLEEGTVVSRWQYLVHGSQQRAVFDMGVLAECTGFPFRLQCEQFRLTRLLLARLQSSPLFTIQFGCELVGVQPGEADVEVALGSDRESERVRCRWLLACDGGRSTVRKQLGLAFEGMQFPKTSITLVVRHPFQDQWPDLLGVNYVWTDSAHYSLMQLRDLWRLSYSPRPDQSIAEALAPEAAQAQLQALFPAARPYELLQRNYYTLQQRCLDSFVVGRVLFAGDAAHLNSPAGGMGMNSGIHDAQCLVEHLLPVLAGKDPAHLQRYDRRRRTIALEEVQRLSARNYARHRETDPARRAEIWRELQATADNPGRQLDYLMDSSMLRSLERERSID